MGSGATGYEDVERGKAFPRVYAMLVKAAEERGTVNYTEVARAMGIETPGHHMARMVGLMLGAITERERACGRPMLSAVAVATGNGQPGKGFYVLAEDLRLIPADASPSEQRAFWEAERSNVYEEWSS